jgi:hypothetical protein
MALKIMLHGRLQDGVAEAAGSAPCSGTTPDRSRRAGSNAARPRPRWPGDSHAVSVASPDSLNVAVVRTLASVHDVRQRHQRIGPAVALRDHRRSRPRTGTAVRRAFQVLVGFARDGA